MLRFLILEGLSEGELLALLAEAKAHRVRDWLMILVGYRHGLRASEVVSLTPDNLRDGYLTIQRLKGSLRTTQPLFADPNPLLDERSGLNDFTVGMLWNQRLFPITRVQFFRLFQKYAEAVGIPAHRRHPHVLKHTIALQTIPTAGIENVRQFLGHKSISSTGAYVRVSDAAASAAIQDALRRV